MSPSTPRRARSNAFDVNRTDRDEPVSAPPPIGRILAPVAPSKGPEAPLSEPLASPKPQVSTAPAGPGGATRPRGSGGRAAATRTRITATAARVPIPLYAAAEELVKGPCRPSWGQLVAATCLSQRDEVVAAVIQHLRREEGALAPRGQNRRAVASTQVTARFLQKEFEEFQATREEATRAARGSGFDTEVTATAVVAAALQVAIATAR